MGFKRSFVRIRFSRPRRGFVQCPEDGGSLHSGVSDLDLRPISRTEAPRALAETAADKSRFRLKEVLGEGAQGQVCRAWDARLEREVALKFPRGSTADRDECEAVLAEARRAAKLDHPNIATVYDCGIWDGRPFIAMQYIAGCDLGRRLREPPTLPSSEALHILRGIVDGLRAAHQAGILHRDLKPQNVLLSTSGEVKLVDFGLGPGEGSRGSSSSGSSVAGRFSAPELKRGEAATESSDIFAVGMIGRTLLSTPASDDVDAILQRCCEPEPEARFASAQQLAAALQHCAESRIETASPVEPSPKKRRGVWSLVAIVGLTGLALFALREVGLLSTKENSTKTTPSVEEPDLASEARGRQLLAEARLSRRAGDRRRLALEALPLLRGDEADEADDIARRARSEMNQITEDAKRGAFDRVLEEAQMAHKAGDLKGAEASLADAEAMMGEFPFLNSRAADLRERRLPIARSASRQLAELGRFGDAHQSYTAAARIADALDRKVAKEHLERLADLAGRLELLAAAVGREPRLVLVQLRRMNEGESFAAALLVEARALVQIGRLREAGRVLRRYLSREADARPLEDEAQALLSALANR